MLTKTNDRIAIDGYADSVESEIDNAEKALIERNVYDDDFKRQVAVIRFFSDKLKALFYQQTTADTEFYAYASTLRYRIDDLKKSLKEVEYVF